MWCETVRTFQVRSLTRSSALRSVDTHMARKTSQNWRFRTGTLGVGETFSVVSKSTGRAEVDGDAELTTVDASGVNSGGDREAMMDQVVRVLTWTFYMLPP